MAQRNSTNPPQSAYSRFGNQPDNDDEQPDNDSMNLPTGKRCKDCKWLYRCRQLFGQKGSASTCDFAPHRFAQV